MEEFMQGKLSQEIRGWFDFNPKLSTMELWIVSLLDPLSVLRSNLPSHHPAFRPTPTGEPP